MACHLKTGGKETVLARQPEGKSGATAEGD